MNVEMLIMPLSQYWAGDFVTPGMERALQGTAAEPYRPPVRRFSRYVASTPEARRLAREERLALARGKIPELIKTFPLEAHEGWNESSSEEPRCLELDRADFEGVLMATHDVSFDHMPHLFSASIFLPPRFLRTFQREGLAFGSLPLLRSELDKVREVSQDAEAAATVMRDAALEAIRLRLPLFVDL